MPKLKVLPQRRSKDDLSRRKTSRSKLLLQLRKPRKRKKEPTWPLRRNNGLSSEDSERSNRGLRRQKKRDSDLSSWSRRELPSKKGKDNKEPKRRNEQDSDQSRDKETKEKVESSQEETINQDRDKRTVMGLKMQEKQKPDQVSGKREPRHQQGMLALKSNQDKVVIKTVRLRESRGSLPSPRDVKMPLKMPSLRLLSLLPR